MATILRGQRVPPRFSPLLGVLIVAIAYYLGAELSRYVAATPQDVTPVWPPDGIAVALVLLWGRNVLSGVFFGSFLANIFAFQDLQHGLFPWILSILPVVGIAFGTTLGTAIGTSLLRQSVDQQHDLSNVLAVLRFVVWVCLLTPLINASVGVSCLAIAQKIPWTIYGNVWVTWWISNVTGILIVAPILLTYPKWFTALPEPRWQYFFASETLTRPLQQKEMTSSSLVNLRGLSSTPRAAAIFRVESILLMAMALGLGNIAFSGELNLEYLLLPVLVLGAFRLGQFWAMVLNFVVAAIAVIETVKGRGFFVNENLTSSLLQLESFIGVITLTLLILTATICERTQAESRLRLAFTELAQANEFLEERVQERTQQLQEMNLELNQKNDILNQTLETLNRTQLQMLQSEKMSALGQMVAGIAHEINNPITFIHGNLVHVKEYVQDLSKALSLFQAANPQISPEMAKQLEDLDVEFIQEDLPKVVDSMQSGTKRVKTIVQSLRNFSRLDEATLKAVDLHEGIEGALVILQHRLNGQNACPTINLVRQYGDLPLIVCDGGAINQVFMNILNNAIDVLLATPNQLEPQITIQTERIGDRVRIMFQDNGSGMTEEVRAKIFDPFFTTKPVGAGTGLGLSISYQIITEKQNGQLWCESQLGQGTKFFVELPLPS